jgi:FlaA1/EpsC-like NDP-sugar epimerase
LKKIKQIFYPESIKRELKNHEFSIFGLAQGGKNLLSALEPLRPTLIFDNDQFKQGKTYRGVPVVSPELVGTCTCSILVISTLNFHIAIYQILKTKKSDITFLIPDPSIIYGFN